MRGWPTGRSDGEASLMVEAATAPVSPISTEIVP